MVEQLASVHEAPGLSPSTRRRKVGRKRRKSSLGEVLERKRGGRKGAGQEARPPLLTTHRGQGLTRAQVGWR